MMRLAIAVMFFLSSGQVLSQDSCLLFASRKIEVFYTTTGEKKIEAKLDIEVKNETGFVKVSESISGVTSIIIKGKLKSDVAVRKDDTSLTWIFPEINGKVQLAYTCTIKDSTVKISGRWITEKKPGCSAGAVLGDTTLAYTPKLDLFVLNATKNRERAVKQQRLEEQRERDRKIQQENERLRKEKADQDRLALLEKEKLKKEQAERDRLALEEKQRLKKEEDERNRLAVAEKEKLRREQLEKERLAKEEKVRLEREEKLKKEEEKKSELEAQYKAMIAQGNMFYDSTLYTDAREYYRKASIIKPKDPYPKQRLAECDKKIKEINRLANTTPLDVACSYRIQISASSSAQNKDHIQRRLPKGSEVNVEQIDEWFKYTTGCFNTPQEAMVLVTTLESMGFKKPFIVKYQNGVRIK